MNDGACPAAMIVFQVLAKRSSAEECQTTLFALDFASFGVGRQVRVVIGCRRFRRRRRRWRRSIDGGVSGFAFRSGRV